MKKTALFLWISLFSFFVIDLVHADEDRPKTAEQVILEPTSDNTSVPRPRTPVFLPFTVWYHWDSSSFEINFRYNTGSIHFVLEGENFFYTETIDGCSETIEVACPAVLTEGIYTITLTIPDIDISYQGCLEI